VKKARKVRLDGKDYKYFLDNGAWEFPSTRDGNPIRRCVLYGPAGSRWFWDNPPEKVSPADVKKAFRELKFSKVQMTTVRN